MSKQPKIESTDEAWETGELGREEEHVKVSEGVNEVALNESLNLIPVSIRLQKSLVDDFKIIARLEGIGYQPLMRQVLTRFAHCEMKRIIRDVLEEQGLTREPDTDEQSEPATEPNSGRRKKA